MIKRRWGMPRVRPPRAPGAQGDGGSSPGPADDEQTEASTAAGRSSDTRAA